METVLHIMNYAASYPGNFMSSLENLDVKLRKTGKRNLYLFVNAAQNKGALDWIAQMKKKGYSVAFLTKNNIQNIRMIRKLVKQNSVSLVHTHFVTMKQFLEIDCALHGLRVPLVMHMHNHSQKAGGIKSWFRCFLYRHCSMVACSKSVYQSLERDYPKNLKYLVDNGVNYERLEQYEKLTNGEFGFSDNDKVFLIFGFDFFRKGVDIAVRAINQLRKKGKPYSLLISLSTNFERVETNIKTILGEFPNWIKIIPARNDVATLYNYVDLFLSPSREEGLPYSVIEAEYSRCSVVLSDIPAQKDLELPYAHWFESENVDAMEEQILRALDERDRKLEKLEAIRMRLRERYNVDAWSKDIIEVYQRVLTK